MENSLVSICCISYNHEKYIEFAIKSFFNQTYKNIEIIALDDGSKDSSVEILTKLSKESPYPFKVISQENSGNVPNNFNKTIDAANGKYLLFISLDDAISNNFIEKKVSILEKDENIKFVISSNFNIIDENSKLTRKDCLDSEFQKLTPNELLEKEFSDYHTFFIQSAIWRTSFINEIGKFDSHLKGDDIVLRTKTFLTFINNTNYKFAFENSDFWIYRLHSTNLSKNSDKIVKILADYYNEFWKDREPAERFIHHFKNYIKYSSIENMFQIFNYNEYTKKLLSNEDIKKAIVDSISDNYSKYGNIYKKIINIPLLKINKHVKDSNKFIIINILGINIKIKR